MMLPSIGHAPECTPMGVNKTRESFSAIESSRSKIMRCLFNLTGWALPKGDDLCEN